MGILVFISYATEDANTFQIQAIAEGLKNYPEIEDVLYWQEDLHDDIYAYMDENIGTCDIFILFCSPNALKSVPVAKEWRAADALNKPLIPVFSSIDYIPPLLRPRLGLQIDVFNVQENIDKLHTLILKKYIPKEESDIPLQFTNELKNKTEIISTKKDDHFIAPIINFCTRNNLSVKNILIMTANGERVPDDQLDEPVASVYSKYGREFLIETQKMQITVNFKICMVGDAESGKTTLLQYCTKTSYDEKYKPTVGVEYWVKPFHYESKEKNFDIILFFWDLGGVFDQSEIPKKDLLNESDGIFLVGDLTRKETFERLELDCVPKIRHILGEEIPIILLANKCDLDHEMQQEAIEEMANRLSLYKTFFTSAKTGENVDEAFKSIIAPMIEHQLKLL